MNEFEIFSTNTSEQPEISESEANRRLGAAVLTNVGFNARNKEIVDSSFNKKNNEKLPGKNDERRNYAYLSRLENLVDKYGNDLEKRLWQNSINDDLLIKYDNITDSYWDSKRQELRDDGRGNIELTDSYKHELFNKERELQEQSLQKWVNYLGDEHSPYPLWFKVYAWDGMTKMGKYDKKKAGYEVRNKTTVAPYPEPDAEVLAGVFDVVNRYYGNSEKEFYTEDGERNVKLEQVVQSGSFPKIFNAIQQDIAPIVEPPEKAEDVHGEWIEYRLGDEGDIARAAMGTGWCIATSSVGRHYLKYGSYGHGNENDWDDEYDGSESNKAKFILFHLEDQNTGKLTKNAVASIRLDPNGQVAEISGLKEGQALNDSLVSTVEEKVKSLPGGVEFLPKFADKNELRRLDRDKMEKGEPLTKEEYEFIYEINRPINTLDTYNTYDPRVYELRKAYGIESALDAGVDANKLAPKLAPEDIAKNLDTLVAHGANIDIDQLVPELDSNDIAKYLDALLNHGADVNELVSRLHSWHIAEYLDTLLAHGADINQLVSKLPPDFVTSEILDTFLAYSADVNQLVPELGPNVVARYLDTLVAHGANIDVNELVSKLTPWHIARYLDTLISHGANIDVNELVSKLTPEGIVENLDTLIPHGANIDINELVSKIDGYTIVRNLDTLLAHGADVNQLVPKLRPDEVSNKILDTLLNHGADANQLVPKLKPWRIAKYLDTLVSHGANIDVNELVSKLMPKDIAEYLDTLLNHGADVNLIMSKLKPEDIAKYRDTLLAHGANI